MITTGENLPRRFGTYLLTGFLGEDALGRVYRALRLFGERGFVRIRILEGDDISEDAVLDAIQENGEIHTFLKNPAIARGVVLDAVDGTPFLAWNEESGRTLDAVLARARELKQSIPYEHALLIMEKVATALDHAYNTTVDGERTLHGLAWPGFVSMSDDGETRLTGFGLATGFLPSLGRPRFAREIAPYLAPEERAQGRVAKNSDVYSAGTMLFELLAGRLPNASDPLADLKSVQRDGAPITPEAAAVLRMCLGTADARFQSSGELRRELGKLLFSGPYSPSTFNLAFFLNGLFSADIEAENRQRSQEASLDPGSIGGSGPATAPGAPPAPARYLPPVPVRDRAPAAGTLAALPPPPPRRPPFVLGGVLLAIAAAVGGGYVLLRRPPAAVPVPRVPTPLPKAEPTPVPVPTSAGPTTAMSDAQFKDEVARRVGQELRKMEQEMRRNAPPAEPRTKASPAVAVAAAAPVEKAPAVAESQPPLPTPSSAPARAAAPEPTDVPERDAPPIPTQAPVSPAASTASEVTTPPKILRIVKPLYPAFALRARIGGIVLLRVTVSETGEPLDVQVLKGVSGGLTQSAVTAVRSWRFEPATRGGVPVRDAVTIPIPFQP